MVELLTVPQQSCLALKAYAFADPRDRWQGRGHVKIASGKRRQVLVRSQIATIYQSHRAILPDLNGLTGRLGRLRRCVLDPLLVVQ